MALGISDFNGTVLTPTVTYPYGDIKDAPGGTVVDRAMMDDVIQFFQNIIDEAGLTVNGLPDNAVNGFQFTTALKGVIEAKVIGTQRTFTSGQGFRLDLFTTAAAFNAQTTLISSTYYRFDLGFANTYEFNLATSPSRDIVSFGNSIAAGFFCYFYFEPTGGSFPITLNSTNAGAFPIIVQDGVVAANTLFTPITGKTYQVIRRTNVWEIIA
jgi:hypothetical protein